MKPNLEQQVVKMITNGVKITQVVRNLHVTRGEIIKIKRAHNLKREYGIRKKRCNAPWYKPKEKKPTNNNYKPPMEEGYYLDRFSGF